MESTKTALDKNHSHFVIVDSGKPDYGGEIEFRASLEAHIGNLVAANDSRLTVMLFFFSVWFYIQAR